MLGLTDVPCGTGPLAVGDTRPCADATYTITQDDIGTTVTNVATVTATPVTGGDDVTAEDETSTPIDAVAGHRA